MIFKSLFGKREEKREKPPVVDPVDTSVDTEEAVSNTPVVDVKIAEQQRVRSKETKENYQLRRVGLRRRAKRTVHTKRGWNKKPVSAKELVNAYDYLKKPIITEKSAKLTESGVYTFRVSQRATKFDVKNAIEARYNVVPVSVRIAKIVAKPKRVRVPSRKHQIGYTTSGKRAYVELKKGDSIQLT